MSTVENIKTKAVVTQILAALCASLGGISNGMQSGWTAPVVPKLQAADSPIPITEADVVWFESLTWIGSFVGIPITIKLLNKYGSKTSTLVAAVQNLISWMLIAFGTSVEYIYVSRFISGVASNYSFVSTPIYIAEIADKKIRGFLGTFTYTTMLMGVIVIYSGGPFMSLLASSFMGSMFLVVQLIVFPFLPDTPYFLLVKGKKEKARKSLQTLRATEDVDAEINEISEAVERQKSEQGRFVDLFKSESNRKAVVIMTMLNFTQHFSGNSVIIMNIHLILQDAMTFSPNTAAIIYSVLLLVAALGTSAIIDKMGRKFMLGLSSVFTGTCLFVIATYFALKDSGVDVQSYSWVLLAGVMIYALSFKSGIGLVPIVMTAEIFPTNVKAMGVTIADALYVIFGFLSINLYQVLRRTYGIHVPFFIFGCCCYMSGLFTMFYIPETKGKTLEEIQLLLKSSRRQYSYGLLENTSSSSGSGDNKINSAK